MILAIELDLDEPPTQIRHFDQKLSTRTHTHTHTTDQLLYFYTAIRVMASRLVVP